MERNIIIRCPKSLLNGPCGGVHDNGLCEISTAKKPIFCLWIEIFNRMRENKKLEEFLKLKKRR